MKMTPPTAALRPAAEPRAMSADIDRALDRAGALGRPIALAGVVLPLALIGALKFTQFEIDALKPLISGTPWIEANFKEDQLAHMRVGQPASVKVDAYDHELKAHVVSFSPGTGSSFALLPAENATGNWVKVVQRLPVRLALDEAAPNLSSGLSAVAKVDVRSALGK